MGSPAATLDATDAPAQNTTRKTFVLIHGAWHGGWCWRRVADLLEARGIRCSRRRSPDWRTVLTC